MLPAPLTPRSSVTPHNTPNPAGNPENHRVQPDPLFHRGLQTLGLSAYLHPTLLQAALTSSLAASPLNLGTHSKHHKGRGGSCSQGPLGFRADWRILGRRAA